MSTKKRRILSGLGGMPKGKRKGKKRKGKKSAASGMRRVARASAVHQSGPKKGKLKPGCKFIKGDGAVCSGQRGKKASKKAAVGKGHLYSGDPKRSSAYKKVGKRLVLKKGCQKISSGSNKGMVLCTRKVGKRRKAA